MCVYADNAWVLYYHDKIEIKCHLNASHYHKYWAFADEVAHEGGD